MPDNEEHSLHQATIVSRAGKSTGKYCNWYNVQFALPESKSGQATALIRFGKCIGTHCR